MRRPFLTFALVAGAAAWLAPAASAWAGTDALSPLRKRLLALPMSGETGAILRLPVGDGTQSEFDVRDSLTLPRALAAKFPGLRSFRGADADGRTLRLDLSASGLRMNVRDGAQEWTARAGTAEEWAAALAGGAGANPFAAKAASHPKAGDPRPAPFRSTLEDLAPGRSRATPQPTLGWEAASAANGTLPQPQTTARGGAIRYDFRLAVAASSRYAAKFGGTVEGALAEVVHAVNQANEVFETDMGVHFTLVDENQRLIRTRSSRDPFRREDPGPAAANLIDREIGPGNYDIGHALMDYTGGESHIGTSCSNARDADFLATHKAAAWSGHADSTDPDAIGFLIHVLGRQLGAWPTASGCPDTTLDDRGVEPGRGTTAMSLAPSACGRTPALQAHADRYFHAANIEQMQDWLASRGGHCAVRRINPASAPWISPASLADRTVVPARTPFFLDAIAEPGTAGRRLTFAWEQMDAGSEQRAASPENGHGPLFRSFPPSPTSRRDFPRMPALLSGAGTWLGETLPNTSRLLNFRLTVRDNGGDTATVAHADKRIEVIDTGKAFTVLDGLSTTPAKAGEPLTAHWDVADTHRAPISCHFVDIDLSLDGGETWRVPALAIDEPNDGEAVLFMPHDAVSEHARLRVRCDWRPFFAVSPADFTIAPRSAY